MRRRAGIIAKTPDTKNHNQVSKTQKFNPSRFQSAASPIDHIMFLQRTIGNQAVQGLFKSGAIQAKLKIGQSNDIYEQEADRVADQVMRMPVPQCPECEEEQQIQQKPLVNTIHPVVQRQDEEEEKPEIMTKSDAGPQANSSNIQNQLNASKGAGSPLPKDTRTSMESAFGADFSGIRVHTDSNAAQMNKELSAQAFTHDSDVYFNQGRYSPDTNSGKHLLAHELTHVVQQETDANGLEGGRIQRVPEELFNWPPEPRREERTPTPKTQPLRTETGYTTYSIPIPGDQEFIIQFYRRPEATGGPVLLRFKTSADDSPPTEIGIPAGHIYQPTILQERDELITFSLDGGENPELYILLSSGQKTSTHDAINPKNPYGPLLMDKEFSTKYVFAAISHPGGAVKYSWEENLPDEAIAEPPAGVWIWGGPLHQPLRGNPRWYAVGGKYKGRSVTIDYGEKASLEALKEGFKAGGKFLGSMAVYSIPYVGPLVMLGEVATGRTIWGDKLSTGERVVFGLLVLIPIVRPLKNLVLGSKAERAAAYELAASRGITSEEATTLIRGTKTITAEEEAFVKSVTDRSKAGRAVSEAEVARASSLVDKVVKNGKAGAPAGEAAARTKVWVSEGRKGRGKYVEVRTPAVEYVRRPPKQYDELIDAAVSERKSISSVPKGKTGASAGGKSNISGWTTQPEAAATVDKVMRESKKIGHKLRTHKLFDQGVPGRFYGSHAEKKAAALAHGKPIAVSSPLCSDCMEFFQAWAKYYKTPVVIAEPNAVRVFKPDGSIMWVPK